MPEAHDASLPSAYYAAVRAELVQRIALRDHVLLAYLAFVGALFGVAASREVAQWDILLVVPYLSLGCAVVVSQHSVVIGTLIAYVNLDLVPSTPAMEALPEFVGSEAFKTHSEMSNVLRSIGHSAIVLLPAVGALVMNYSVVPSGFPLGYIWLASAFCVTIATGTVFYTHVRRQKVFAATKWFARPPAK